MRIGEPARKHGVDDDDILHVWRNPMRRVDSDDNLTMLIGPDMAGRMLEVGVLGIDSDDPVAIHAMPLRPKFYEFL
ncbi:hypothetical protein [Phytoactinopolyspora halotolerans]|uniref:Toxin n=1 Tax=Phytoactinopolyspora halotolerans TaxID=1981512 RepID=A0A6L9SEY3_9ACTN|nr:hypothetical protein [Phytoactinopolyspora halotolerans]NEE03796.1 hypothetical protein [Phytoactinopolyspora halotolerans]